MGKSLEFLGNKEKAFFFNSHISKSSKERGPKVFIFKFLSFTL